MGGKSNKKKARQIWKAF